jgi:alkanesulfonate monooxygenase SsuD/methylene tetrahydromethanopterin reductase-like flavin-dependent oxidoreductase (luciferase family)
VTALKLGVQPITYSLTWPESLAAAMAVERLGFDYLWGHDHLYSSGGDPFQPFFEGWTTITAWAALTSRVQLGVLVGANPFRNPGVVAKMAASIDHISGGRFILGLGAGNRELESEAHGIDAGASVGERLDWLDESLSIIGGLLAGREVTHHSDKYHFQGVRHAPLPLRSHVPVLVGTLGEKKGLRIAAQHADIWQCWLGAGDAEVFRRKSEILSEHCTTVDRDPSSIERTVGGKLVLRATEGKARRDFEEQRRMHGWHDPSWSAMAWLGTSEQVAEAIATYRAAGAHGFTASVAAPLDLETIERLATEVRPMLAETA